MTTEAQSQSNYPTRLNIDYVGTGRNRLTTFFRIMTAIPILLVISAFQNATVVIPTLLMILFRQI